MRRPYLSPLLAGALLASTIQPLCSAAAVRGDVDGDALFSVTDLISVQKFLLGAGSLKNWQGADLCGDCVIDGFDLCRMKRELLSGDTADDVNVSTAEELAAALKNAEAGDVIRIASGTYDYTAAGGFKGTADGTESKPIILTAQDPANPPVLTGNDCSTGYVLHVTGDYWIVKDLLVTSAQKGIVFDNANHSVIENCEIFNTGAEAIAIRDGSSYCTVQDSYIHDTGTVTPGYGEGVYIGSAKSTSGYVYECDCNTVNGCTFKNVAAEHVDVKEYTTGSVITNCTFYGDGMTGANNAGSFVDIAGNNVTVSNNIGWRNGNEQVVAAFELHEQAEGWGYGCTFTDNTVYMDQPYGAINTSRRMYVVDGWFSDFSVRNNQVDYGEGLVPANSWEYYNSDYVVYLE